jgi:amino acid transporter
MQGKWLFGIGVVAVAAISVYFIIQQNIYFAVMAMMVLFVMTNAARSVSFKKQGLERESKWMRWLSIFFGIAFIVLLVMYFL